VIYALVPILVLALCLFLGKRLATLVVIVAYLNVEGFLKLLSNYNRVVHVGMDIVVTVVAAAWLADAIARRSARVPPLPWVRVVLLYALWIGLQVFSPMSPGVIPFLAALKLYLTMVPLYFMAAAVVRTRDDVVWLVAALVAIAVLPYAVALAQYTLGPRSVIDLSPRFAQNLEGFHEWRPFGLSPTPGGTSVLAFLTTPLAVALWIGAKGSSRLRTLSAASITLAGGVFLVTGGRQLFLGCLLALAAMFVIVGLRRRGRGLLSVAMVVLFGFAGIVAVENVLKPVATQALLDDPTAPDIWRRTSVTDRLGTLTDTRTLLTARAGAMDAVWRRVERYPFGVGLGRLGPGATALRGVIGQDPESNRIERELGFTESFFAVQVQELGLPGLLLAVTLLVGLPLTAGRVSRASRDSLTMALAGAIAGVFFGVLVMSWGSQPMTSNPVFAYYWLIAGLLAAVVRLERADDSRPKSADAAKPDADRAVLA